MISKKIGWELTSLFMSGLSAAPSFMELETDRRKDQTGSALRTSSHITKFRNTRTAMERFLYKNRTRLTFRTSTVLRKTGFPPPLKVFSTSLKNQTHRPVVGGNRLEMFEGGEKAYPAMLVAISLTRSNVFLSSYIFLKDKTGQRFMDALGEAARRGVDVKVLLDGVGELYSFYRTGG
ncbi:MAG: hypothetical protein RRA15_07610 [bacterium]|nr:hypothetical protein [bacterium]